MTPTHPPPLKAPQFSLRTLFLLITLAACLCALANIVSPLVLAGVVFLILSIAAHVVGNKLGTVLHDHARRQRQAEGEHQSGRMRPIAGDFAPHTQLRDRKSLGLIAAMFTLFGVLAGTGLSIGGAFWLHANATRADLIVVGVAGGVLGGIWTFAIASFLQVGSSAAWQAMQDPKAGQLDED